METKKKPTKPAQWIAMETVGSQRKQNLKLIKTDWIWIDIHQEELLVISVLNQDILAGKGITR